MKKIIIRMIDIAVFILSFLFILSSFFNVISHTFLGEHIYNSAEVLVIVWIIGILFAVLLTHPLFRWILHFRYSK